MTKPYLSPLSLPSGKNPNVQSGFLKTVVLNTIVSSLEQDSLSHKIHNVIIEHEKFDFQDKLQPLIAA